MQQLIDQGDEIGRQIQVDSAGIGGWHQGEPADARMRQHAARRGIRIPHLARQIQVQDFHDFDLIVAMDDKNYDALRDLAPTVETQSRVVRMADYLNTMPWDHIPDPYYGGAEGFELVLDLLTEGCRTLYRDCRSKLASI